MTGKIGNGTSSAKLPDRRRARLRILLIAPACDGTDVSESAVAYRWASRLSARHDVTILTYRKRERLSARSQFPAARFVEWQEWPLVGRVGSLNNLLQPSYAGFYLHARRWIRAAEVRNEHFDIVHQLTPMALRYPSPAAGLVPRLVVGPMAGALPTPPGFRAEMAASPWYTKLRRVDQWRFRHDPVLRRSMSAASVVIGAATYVRDVLGDVPLRRFEVMNELGVDELPPMPKRPSRPPGQLRALFVGRIIRSKGLRDAIRAWSSLEGLPHVTLDVVGEGEDRAACETEARQLGVSGRVRFHGWLARSEVNRLYGESDMFVFPSFREPTGGVIIEAMSFGLPVVTAQYGGPAELVNDESGVRVPPIAPEQYARALAAAVARLASDPRAREAQGLAARRRVETQFLWSTKLTWLEDLYGELLESELTVAH